MLEIMPMTLKEANAFVEQNHRHHGPVVGHKFSIGLSDSEKIAKEKAGRRRGMVPKNVSPRTESDTRAISNGWVVTDNGMEIATITMSVTTLRDFQEKHIGKLLTSIADGSHSFYLEVGNELKNNTFSDML